MNINIILRIPIKLFVKVIAHEAIIEISLRVKAMANPSLLNQVVT